MFLESGDISLLYSDIHWFNEQVAMTGQTDFFANYVPVPPFSLLFYVPFTFLPFTLAKIIVGIISLFLFCFSLNRFLKNRKLPSLTALVVLVFSFALWQNFAQGQIYLFIAALLLEIFIAYEKRKIWSVAIFIALGFHLKIFPALVLIYFLFRGEWKIIVYSLTAIFLLLLVSTFLIGQEVMMNYYAGIFPRLMKNEVIDPFYSGHQGLNILLRNLFVPDDIHNPMPLIGVPWLLPLVQGIIDGFLIYAIYVLIKREKGFSTYAMFILVLFLLNKYTTSYSLVMMLPFVLFLAEEKKMVPLLLLTLAVNIPLSGTQNLVLPLPYFRILLLIFIFFYVLRGRHFSIQPLKLSAVCILLAIFNLWMFRSVPNHYFSDQIKPGIQYDFEIKENNLTVRYCRGGEHDAKEFALPFKVEKAVCIEPAIKFNRAEGAITGKSCIINDTLLLYLSDVNQGVGMMVLRRKRIK